MSEELPPDPMTDLGHLLIRAYNGDTFDPFFVIGHPSLPKRDNQIVRSCFYYAVVMTPKLTVLFDNDGRGGMCEMVPEEIGAIWRTPALLEAMGLEFEALKEGRAVISATTAPPPDIRPWDLDTDKKLDESNPSPVP